VAHKPFKYTLFKLENRSCYWFEFHYSN